jgi:hypothetical protein
MDRWIKAAERMPDPGQMIVKRWYGMPDPAWVGRQPDTFWAGRYNGTEKDSSFDAWYPLPEEN